MIGFRANNPHELGTRFFEECLHPFTEMTKPYINIVEGLMQCYPINFENRFPGVSQLDIRTYCVHWLTHDDFIQRALRDVVCAVLLSPIFDIAIWANGVNDNDFLRLS